MLRRNIDGCEMYAYLELLYALQEMSELFGEEDAGAMSYCGVLANELARKALEAHEILASIPFKRIWDTQFPLWGLILLPEGLHSVYSNR